METAMSLLTTVVFGFGPGWPARTFQEARYPGSVNAIHKLRAYTSGRERAFHTSLTHAGL